MLPHKQGSGTQLLITTAHTAELFLTFTDVRTGVHVRQHHSNSQNITKYLINGLMIFLKCFYFSSVVDAFPGVAMWLQRCSESFLGCCCEVAKVIWLLTDPSENTKHKVYVLVP